MLNSWSGSDTLKSLIWIILEKLGTKANTTVVDEIANETEENSTRISAIQEQVDSNSNSISEMKDELSQIGADNYFGYIKIDETIPNISIGRNSDVSKVEVTDEGVKIIGSDNASLDIKDSFVSTPQALISNLKVGGYQLIHRTTNDHVSLKWGE